MESGRWRVEDEGWEGEGGKWGIVDVELRDGGWKNKGAGLETGGLRMKGGEGRMEGGRWKAEKCPQDFRLDFSCSFPEPS